MGKDSEMRPRWIVPSVVLAVASAAGLVLWPSEQLAPPWGPSARTSIERGREVYAAQCASCHGANLAGEANWKSPRADGSYPAPPHDVTGHTWHHGDGVLFRIIKEGGGSYATPSMPSRMPPFGDQLCDVEVRAVIEYLKSRWGPAERKFQADVSVDSPYPPPGAPC